VNHERVRDGFLDAPYVQQMFGGGLGPSLHALFAANLFHQNAQEVPAVLALRHDSRLKFLRFEARTLVKARGVPGVEHFSVCFAACSVGGTEVFC
jgi:hypothetical protein